MKICYDLSRQMQDDLIKAYNRVAPTSWTQVEAYQRAVKERAPRYYISAKQAAQIISKMVVGDTERVDFMRPNKKRMYYSLFQKFMELSEKRMFVGKSLSYIMQYAVLCEAPEFFVSPYVLAKIRSFIKHGYLDDSGKVVNNRSRIRDYEKLKERRARLKAYREQFKKSSQ